MKKYKPTTPSRRNMSGIDYKEKLSGDSPYKPLLKGTKRHAGRNSYGRITTRHQGGGHKRRLRLVDFRYDKRDIPARVETIEYDPHRSGFIGLVCYADGERRYVLLPQSVEVGTEVLTSEKAPQKPGNRMPLKSVPIGTFVYNIELKPEGGAKIARSAGNYAEVIAHDAGYVHLKMPSSEVRKVIGTAWASIGEVSNEEHRLVKIGKAGRARWMGRRPTVRGSAMNPVDHPYGGGEGRAGRGRRRAVSKWGKPTGKGQKTRRSKKYSNANILQRRKVGKRRK
jgi:large subunit ribosomal protein L2